MAVFFYLTLCQNLNGAVDEPDKINNVGASSNNPSRMYSGALDGFVSLNKPNKVEQAAAAILKMCTEQDLSPTTSTLLTLVRDTYRHRHFSRGVIQKKYFIHGPRGFCEAPHARRKLRKPPTRI